MFKVGDRVLCIDDSDQRWTEREWLKVIAGQVYVIASVSPGIYPIQGNVIIDTVELVDMGTDSFGCPWMWADTRFILATSENIKIYENELEMLI